VSIAGILPAAGRARRLGRLPCSKEILPVGIGPDGVRPAIACALDAFAKAGVEAVRIVIAPGKEDIAAYLGARYGKLSLSYPAVIDSRGAPDSVRAGLSGLEGHHIALAFPDILFEPTDAIERASRQLAASAGDLCLALVPSDRGDKVDLVECDTAGRVTGIAMKPGAGRSGLTWVAAVWTPRFTAHLLSHRPVSGQECYMGEVILSAATNGLAVTSVTLPRGRALDIGTPDDLASAWQGARR
jgi:glucose-1-phosphate thymidylyltransferase